jgi:hypothetical protein
MEPSSPVWPLSSRIGFPVDGSLEPGRGHFPDAKGIVSRAAQIRRGGESLAIRREDGVIQFASSGIFQAISQLAGGQVAKVDRREVPGRGGYSSSLERG